VTARIARAEAAQGGLVTEQTVPNYLIPIGDVKVGPRIGRGALGEVLLGEYESTRVALKGLHMLRTDEASQAEWGGALSAAERTHLLDQFKRECDTMRGLVHENILPFVGVVVDNTPVAEPLYLATQFIESGTLHDVLHAAKYAVMRSDGGCIPLETQLTVFVGMFAGLAFLAEKRLIHRDIKPANILAVVDGSRLTKVLLADFGESKQLTATMTRVAGTAAGTPLYMAPEMGQEEDAKGSKADVFSAGVVLIETNTGQLPNPGPTKRKEGRRRVDIPEKERRAADLAAVRHPEVWELASRCIVDFDGERADAAEMLERCLALGGQDAPVRSSSIFMVNISSQERIQLDVTAATTVADLKRQAVATMDLPHGSAVGLIFCGRKMEDQRTVDDYNLLDGTVVYLDFDLDLEP
jgi:serine/threonine protein kinase